ncbi:MAG: molybdenum cofactor biosynthesis protein MoaD [Glaciihabitans sp.]|nr:molybdenum cofactor biosynthesis protein MoaD [Glaciihabitans sp.]
MANIRLRFFAAARAAAGIDETSVTVSSGATIGDALALFAVDRPDVSDVVSRCSFLVNGIAETNPLRPLADGDLVDVMPPFAGG